MGGFSLTKAIDPLGLFTKKKEKKSSSVADPALLAAQAADASRQRNLQLLAGGAPTTVFSQNDSANGSISKNTLGAT